MGVGGAKEIVKTNLENLKDAMKQGNLQDLACQIHQELDLLEGTTVDVAITGVSGAGKSSFVNAVRGMADCDKGAAATGVKQTTMGPKAYQHPTFPNVTVWDLPGIGTREFKANEYLKKFNFGKYDFFIIVAAERFTEHDEMLACEIQKLKKKFYFVRTKVDTGLEAESRKPDYSEEKTLQQIREYCCENLTTVGGSAPRVFLISSWHLDRYDFPLLQETLLDDLNEMKRHALILALPSFSKEILQKKKAAMEDVLWRQAVVSSYVEAFPVPHTPLVCNILNLVGTLRHFYKVFGLDDDSLHRLAKWVGKPVAGLRSAIQKSPMASEITEEFVTNLLSKFLEMQMFVDAVMSHLEASLTYLPDEGRCFKTTFFLLKYLLNAIVEDAGNVWAKAAECEESQKTLAADLNDLKRPLLAMAMPAFSREHLQEKKAVMEKLILKKALVSCGIGAIPIPGLSLIADIAVLVDAMKESCKTFGLDEESLRNLAEQVGKPIDVLKSAVKKTPMVDQINPQFVRSLMTTSEAAGSAMALENVSDFIPVLGSIPGGVNSFATTYYVLKGFLEDAVQDAENVLAKVAEQKSC